MRIAVINWSNRKVGGIETYLDTAIPLLAECGNEVALWHQTNRPINRELISIPGSAPCWCSDELGEAKALKKLVQWKPDVIYAHGLLDDSLEAEIPQLAPAVFFLHQYHGTCVSGGKTWKWPSVVPCDRRFGWQCLLHYYPHHCGGWHPATMVKMFKSQSRKLNALQSYRALVTHTEHMRTEYVRHGFLEDRVFKVPFPVRDYSLGDLQYPFERPTDSEVSNVLFVGRMDQLKGGAVLLESASLAARQLGRTITLTLAGDGPERHTWEQIAAELQDTDAAVGIIFPGWVETSELPALYRDADLVVMPSLWPEPLGMVGIEAGYFGVPSVAFGVGGIPEWLHDGRNGRIAPGDTPSAAGLASAIVDCLENKAEYQRLCEGAHEASQRFTPTRHVDALVEVLRRVVTT